MATWFPLSGLKHARLVLGFPLLLLTPSSLALEAESKKPGVPSSDCFNGFCNNDGTCECNPCWKGPTCQEYVDRFSPRFLAEEPFFMVQPGSESDGENQVPLFRLESGDDDLGLTCQLGQVGPAATCPCATPRYKVVGASSSVFRADQETGDVFIKPGYSLRPGQHYIIWLQVAALKVNATGYKGWSETLGVDLWVKPETETATDLRSFIVEPGTETQNREAIAPSSSFPSAPASLESFRENHLNNQFRMGRRRRSVRVAGEIVQFAETERERERSFRGLFHSPPGEIHQSFSSSSSAST